MRSLRHTRWCKVSSSGECKHYFAEVRVPHLWEMKDWKNEGNCKKGPSQQQNGGTNPVSHLPLSHFFKKKKESWKAGRKARLELLLTVVITNKYVGWNQGWEELFFFNFIIFCNILQMFYFSNKKRKLLDNTPVFPALPSLQCCEQEAVSLPGFHLCPNHHWPSSTVATPILPSGKPFPSSPSSLLHLWGLRAPSNSLYSLLCMGWNPTPLDRMAIQAPS